MVKNGSWLYVFFSFFLFFLKKKEKILKRLREFPSISVYVISSHMDMWKEVGKWF